MIKMLVIVMLLGGCKGDEERPRRDPDGPPSSLEVRLARIKADMAAIDENVASATTAVANAKDETERVAAQARLEALQKDQRDMKLRVEAAKAAAQKCIDNPIATGCR